MSLSGAIEAMRRKVPPVPAPENHGEPLETPEIKPVPPENTDTGRQIRCAECAHQITTDHPALVTCRAGRESPAACGTWWKFDPRRCDRFAPTADPSP